MAKSWLRYLGLLGLLGLLGIVTGNEGFLGFFGFFGYFGFGRLRHDERLEQNVNRAARNAYLTANGIFAIGAILSTFLPPNSVFGYGFAVMFGLQVLVFSISLSVYEGQKGSSDAKDKD